jgi:hypothetical protein
MNTDVNTVRLLGAAQLIVIVGSLIMDSLLSSAVGSGSMSDILMNISKNLPQMRFSNLVALGQTLAIVVMGVLYYVVFYKQYKIIALVALGCFLIAGITIAISKIGANALIPLSQELWMLVYLKIPIFKRWAISYTLALIDGATRSICCSCPWVSC